MTVDLFAEVLTGSNVRIMGEQFYRSKNGIGFSMRLKSESKWYWVRISGTCEPIDPTSVSEALISKSRTISRCGFYKNGLGFEATVKSGNHWYMLGHCA